MINLRLYEIRKAKIPLIVWIVMISTYVASAVDFSFLGRAMAGWAWVIPFILSMFIIVNRPRRVSFPATIWLPWTCIVIGYFIASNFVYLQRNIMLLCPLVVGMAISTERIREIQLNGFLELMRSLAILIFAIIAVKTGLLFTGVLPARTGFAAQSMTVSLLCCICAARYSFNRKKDLFTWLIGAAVPFISLTRTAIVVVGSTIPFTFAPLGIKKRLIFIAIVGVLCVIVFYTERMQTKMFYSGEGTLDDVSFSNPDLFTGGRSRLWNLMIEEIKAKPFVGHGANASEEYVYSMTWGTLRHPHNDWLRLLYDYGLFGTSVFGFCLVWQVIHMLRRADRSVGESRTLIYAGASSFLPFILFMLTDNIILYASFFGNLQFTVLGLAYAARKTREVDTQNYYRTMFANRFINLMPTRSVPGEGAQKSY